MDDIDISAFGDELEKIAFYGEIFPKAWKTGVPRAVGRSAKEVIRNIRKKIAPRAPEKAKEMERGIEEAIKVHPKKGKHVAWRFGPDEETSATSARMMRAMHKAEGINVKDKAYRKVMGAMGVGGKPGQIMSSTTTPSMLAHEMGHIRQHPSIGTLSHLSKNPAADEIDATRRALKAMGKKDDVTLSYGLASHHAASSPSVAGLKAETDFIPLNLSGGTKLERLGGILDRGDPEMTMRLINAMGRKGTERNIHLLPKASKEFNDMLRARRRLSERFVGQKLGPAAEKKLRRKMNRMMAERFLNPRTTAPLPG